METGQESNLGKVIKDIVVNQKFEQVQQVYIVDKQTGPYRNIQQAIDEATPGALIKISQGIYSEVLKITKPLTLEPKIYNVTSTKDGAGVILLVSSGIAIEIDIPQGQQSCKIRGIKVSHSANVKIQSYQNDIIDNDQIFGFLDKNKNSIYSLDCEYVNKVKPQNLQNMIIWIKSGTLILQSSLLSLSFIVKSCNSVVPAVFVSKGAKIIMTKCQTRGNVQHETIGIISKQGIVELNSCRLSSHKNGAILLWGTNNNDSRILHTNIQQSDIGIHVVGQQNNALIKRTIITKCRLAIKVGLAVMCQITGSYIIDNEIGIQVHSAFPLITKNRIQKNKYNGIGLFSYKKMICQAVIRMNHSIVGNKQNGILIEGIRNYSKIMQNVLIGFNSKSGIRVDNQAHPHIILNKIYKNMEHGILLIQNSSATIEKNEVISNVKINIGLGGYKSNNTTIMENRIKGSKGEGIFMTQCSGASILRNDILENNDGIVALSSTAIVNRNFISKNQANGVLLLKQTQLQLCQNFISENQAVGIYFRDKSFGTIESNVVDGNEIDINLQTSDSRHSQIASMNTVDGEIRVPNSIGCLLF